MRLRSLASRYLPKFIKKKIRSKREKNEMKIFNSLKHQHCQTRNLRARKSISLNEIFYSEEIDKTWFTSKDKIDNFDIPDGSGGVNPGDRRALYYLISHLKPSSVLEIGTHIGASTLHIASALNHFRTESKKKVQLTTLDIRDVNSTFEKPWLQYGAQKSPLEMIKKLKFESFVSFISADSLKYMNHSNQKFDFIFLDGSHTAPTVYQEIPAALQLLNPNGLILLHDYYPGNEPLWSNKSVISGPYIAVERLINEGADLTVMPIGNLPWETKLNSNVTSLALLLRE